MDLYVIVGVALTVFLGLTKWLADPFSVAKTLIAPPFNVTRDYTVSVSRHF
jgi:hypothetical protein